MRSARCCTLLLYPPGTLGVKSLLALVLLPLVVGLFIRACYADHAKAWQPELVKAANLALVIARWQ